MSQQKRSRLSSTQKTDIWRRWKTGQSLHEIGRAYGKLHPSIRCVLLFRGGIPPISRRRSRLALTLVETSEAPDAYDTVRADFLLHTEQFFGAFVIETGSNAAVFGRRFEP